MNFTLCFFSLANLFFKMAKNRSVFQSFWSSNMKFLIEESSDSTSGFNRQPTIQDGCFNVFTFHVLFQPHLAKFVLKMIATHANYNIDGKKTHSLHFTCSYQQLESRDPVELALQWSWPVSTRAFSMLLLHPSFVPMLLFCQVHSSRFSKLLRSLVSLQSRKKPSQKPIKKTSRLEQPMSLHT